MEKNDYWLRYVSLTVRPHGKNSASAGRIFMKFDISVFFENLSEISSVIKL